MSPAILCKRGASAHAAAFIPAGTRMTQGRAAHWAAAAPARPSPLSHRVAATPVQAYAGSSGPSRCSPPARREREMERGRRRGCGGRSGIGPRRLQHGCEARAVVRREPCQGKQGRTWLRDGGGASPETIRRVARGEPENSGSSGAAAAALRPHPALPPSAPAERRFPRS